MAIHNLYIAVFMHVSKLLKNSVIKNNVRFKTFHCSFLKQFYIFDT